MPACRAAARHVARVAARAALPALKHASPLRSELDLRDRAAWAEEHSWDATSLWPLFLNTAKHGGHASRQPLPPGCAATCMHFSRMAQRTRSLVQRRQCSPSPGPHLDIHAGGQVQGHEAVDGGGGQVLHVNQPLVQAHLRSRGGAQQASRGRRAAHETQGATMRRARSRGRGLATPAVGC